MAKQEESIIIKGAREHNLKNVDLTLPKNKLIVFTGVSGSGKSSLCMDTLYAEGQRRYVESLSSYARQFLMRMNKPDVDYIKGITPAIAIEQKVSTRTTRSTVGTLTEIYDYLRLLYARVGKTISPISGKEVKKHEVKDVVDFIFSCPADTKVQLFAPILLKRKIEDELNILMQKGFTRVLYKKELYKIEDLAQQDLKKNKEDSLWILIDRVVADNTEDNHSRIADSVQTCFYEGNGECIVDINQKIHVFNNKFELDGMRFEEPTQHFFNFNNPYGACKTCEGFGTVIGIDEDLIIPDKNLSVYEGAIACWKGEKMKEWNERLIKNGIKFDFPIHRSIKDLTKEEKKILWTGNEYFQGLTEFFKFLEAESYKIQYRVMLSRYRGRTICNDCQGSRLRADSNYVKIGAMTLSDLLMTPIDEAYEFFDKIKLSKQDQHIADRIIVEIKNRLKVMVEIGLGYLTLNRFSNTLSGGETQRINLTRILGSNLTDSLYMLDEPSIGLHPKDTEKLIMVIKQLRDMGNTVIVVEHDEEMIREADFLVDMGPYAGVNGGEVVFSGHAKDLKSVIETSLTAQYMLGKQVIEVPQTRRKFINSIEITGASHHNLKNIDVKFPLQALTIVTGVSGSGKTTLVKKILYPLIANLTEDNSGEKPGFYKDLKGEYNQIKQVELIDQNPLGRTSRSNAVTYTKSYDAIRELFAQQQLSKLRGFKPKDFSFNVEGGRCETCKGDGEIVVEMQFLADVHLVCDSCKGKRFKDDVLEVTYKEKNIFEILSMSIDEAMEFFIHHADIRLRIKPLQDIGLGYITLGQSTSTLSGGEAQRLKLASFLGKGAVTHPVLFIFDEPTTGLHFYDVQKLLYAFDALIKLGHTLVVIEHNLDVIKCADWLIDLGPEGGKNGGDLMFQGVPEDILANKKSQTARFLKEKLNSK
ncbi:MAG: excinuclease ABC subunit UvrA [Bacteroidota bacterium]